MAVRTLVEAVRDGLAEEMRRDWRVIVLGEDVGVHGGVFRATDGLYAEFGKDRVIDTPIAELGIVGTAIGSALNGLRPVAEIQFADYIFPAIDQIVNEAAKIRYRTNGGFGCPLVIRAPYGAGIHGALYHSQSVEAFFLHVPGLKVVTPSTPYDAKGLLKAAVRDEDPVLFFEHKRTYRRVRGEVPEEDYVVPIGVAEVKRVGQHVSVVTYGAMVHQALEAADALAAEGISVEVVDLRSLLPWDRETVAASVSKTNKVVICHEDSKTAGVGAEVAAFIGEELFDQLDGPITRVAALDTPVPFAPTLEEAVIPGTRHIVDAVRRLAAY
ncbi:MAG TPA: alpha-ketoacid dehydrogenase subunit beta [Chloroflexota bacterium]|nr:alpha-ketoacid dehydrogenase subunit beta [Chloroflexota bacterium]